MDTLLLSVQASGRDAPLTEVLGEQYDLVNSALSLAARDQIPQADLLIVDHATFLEVGSEAIEAFRDREPRIASPVLLLVPRPRLAGLDPEIWEHVDDVLGTPVRPPELKGRVRSLLRLRRSTEKIEEERERLATAQRIAGLGSWHRDFETDELHWSAETRRLFGWAPDEAVTVEKFMDAVHPDDREALRRQQKQLFEEGSPVDVEYRVVRPDGEERILHERGEAEFADDGTLLRASGTVLDVTDQRDRERELRVLSEAVEQAGEAVLITEGAPLDEPGPAIVYANSAFEEMSGYDEEEVLGRTPRMLQGPDTDREVLDSLREALEAGRSWKGETVNYHKDGHPYRVRWNVAPVSNSEGEIDYWVSVQRDVTEEWEREEALRRQRNLLEQTQRLAGAWETDLRTGTTTWSEEVYQIHELPLEAEPGLEESFEFYPSEVQSQLRAAFERCIEEGERYDLELPLITAKGNHRWVRTVGGPVEKEDGSVVKVAGAIQDITDRKEAERTLREERDRFATLFHNLPTPVVYGHPDDQSRLRVQAVNKAFESVFGYEQAEIRGADIQSLIVPDGETADVESIRRRLMAGEPVDRTVQRKAADGLRDFRLQVTLREGESGPTEGYAIYTDVTDERHRRASSSESSAAATEGASGTHNRRAGRFGGFSGSASGDHRTGCGGA